MNSIVKKLFSALTVSLLLSVIGLVPTSGVNASQSITPEITAPLKFSTGEDNTKAVEVLRNLREIQAKGGNPKHKTGAKPTSKEIRDKFPKHNKQRFAAPPPAYMMLPSKLSYWLNDTYGDCVSAEEAFHFACAGIFIQDNVVETWASKYGFLNGADLPSVMQQMASGGFQQDGNTYGDGPYVTVDYTSWTDLTSAVAVAPVKIGVASTQLQNVVGQTNGWIALNFTPDSNEDHCISICGYGTLTQLCSWFSVPVPTGADGTTLCCAIFTWDTVGIMSFTSMQNITQEAYLRNPSVVISGTNTPTPDQVVTYPVNPTPTPSPTPTPTPTPIPTPTPVPSTNGTVTFAGTGTTLDGGTFTLAPNGSVIGPPGSAMITSGTTLAELGTILNSFAGKLPTKGSGRTVFPQSEFTNPFQNTAQGCSSSSAQSGGCSSQQPASTGRRFLFFRR